jgi:glycosyltransferase involved in cell wall biosynthesis
VHDLLARGDVDVVHSFCPPASALARTAGLPFVQTLHHPRDPELEELYLRAQAPNVSLVGVSERQRRLLPVELNVGHVIHDGLDARAYPPGDGQGGYVTLGAPLSETRGVIAALQGAERAGLKVRVAGEPESVHDELLGHVLRAQVTLGGDPTHGGRIAVLGGALAMLASESDEQGEPSGIAFMEAMLCGTPVVALARGVAAELIDEGVTGWVVRDVDEMAARLRRLASGRDEDQIDRGRCRRTAADRFGAARMVAAYLEVYDEARGERARADLR